MVDVNTTADQPASGLYHFVWRWHFYAGLIVAPFLVLLAVTGGLYLFEREIDGALHADVVHVAPTATVRAASAQEAEILRVYPGAKIGRYEAPIAPDRAAEWAITTRDGKALAVFVDPGAARITGVVAENERLTSILSKLHGELMIGRVGDLIVEFAASWAFILLVTGLFLWWPRAARKAGVLAPRLDAKGRSFWRDLHAVPAMWNAPIIAFLILTGLPWSGFWGDTLARLGTVNSLAPIMAPTPNFSAFPDAPPHHASAGNALTGHPQADELPWAVRHVSLPISSVHTGHDAGRLAEAQKKLHVDEIVAMAQARGMNQPGLRVFYPQSETGVFTASFVPATAQAQRTLHVNPQDGAVLADIGWAQYSPLGKAVEFGVMTHLGRQFGVANQILMATACALLVATIGAGLWMWQRRRPSGRLGAPPIPADHRLSAAVVATAIGLGIVFPLAGVSIALIAFLDFARTRLSASRKAIP